MVAVEGAEQEPGAAHAGGERVDVGIGLPSNQAVSVAHHLGRDVGVQIERADDWHVRSHDGPGRLQQVALHVTDFRRDRRAVQCQEDAVYRQSTGEVFKQIRFQLDVALL